MQKTAKQNEDAGNQMKESINQPSVQKMQATQYKILSTLIVIFSEVVFFIYGSNSGKLVFVTGNSSIQIAVMASLTALTVSSLIIPKKYYIFAFYLSSITLLIYAGLFLVSLHSVVLTLTSAVAFVLYLFVWINVTKGRKGSMKKLVTFMLAMGFMYYVGDLLQIITSPAGYPATITWIGGLFLSNVAGTPLLMKYGIEVYAPFYAISLSPVSFVIFFSISSLLTENYFSIFGLLKSGNNNTKIQGAAYGIISSLSCQCEGGISLLPTMAILIISITMVPILLESFILLLLTNYFINRYYVNGLRIRILSRLGGAGIKSHVLILAAVLFIGTPVFEMIGIYLGLISNMLFFFGTGILMTLSAYFEISVLGKLIGYKRSLNPLVNAALLVVGSVLMFIWYLPFLTIQAVSNPSIFVLMNVSGIAAGLSFGAVRLSVKRGSGQLLDEFLALMFGMPPIIVFYISAMPQVLIWPEFGLLQQLEFGLVVWVLVLPFMWLTTNISLNDAKTNVESFVLPKVRNYQGSLYKE